MGFHVSDMNMDPMPFERHFGGLFSTMSTMFMAAIGGMSFEDFWGPFDSISMWYRLLIVAFVCFFMFGFMNVITAIVIDGVIFFSAMERDWQIRNTMACDDSPLQKLKRILQSGNRARDGFISLKHLRRELIQNDQVTSLLGSLRLHADQVEGLATLVDKDDNDCISIEELVLSIMQLHGNPNHIATMLYDTKKSVSRLNHCNKQVQERLDKVLLATSLVRSIHTEETI